MDPRFVESAIPAPPKWPTPDSPYLLMSLTLLPYGSKYCISDIYYLGLKVYKYRAYLGQFGALGLEPFGSEGVLLRTSW